MRRARRTGVALAAVGAALAVAACGSSSGAGGTGTAGGGNTAKADFGLKFSDCMRSHGV